MRAQVIGLMVLALALAACGAPAVTPTAVGATLAPERTPTLLSAGPSATPAPANTEAAPVVTKFVDASATPEATNAADAADAAMDAVLGDPVLRTYRVMVAMQVNAMFLANTAQATVTGEMEGDDIPVSVLVFGALTQSVDEDAAGVAPPPELAAAWQAALAAHAGIKQVSGQWLLGQLSTAEVLTALAPLQADLEAALVQADAAVAVTYDVQAASLTAYRARVTLALEKLFE